jgi:hypothetical protein
MNLAEYIKGRPVVQISTVYFDTPEYDFARKAINNGSVSVKLRSKEYSYKIDGTLETSNFCWIEIKSRNGLATEKWRFPLSKSAFPELLQGRDIGDVVAESARKSSCTEEALENYKRFLGHIERHQILPSTVVTYSRRVYELKEWDLRLTLDSDVRYYRAPRNPYAGTKSIIPAKLGQPIGEEDTVIVETKSGNGLPGWLWPMLRACESAQEFSKFVTSSRRRMRLELNNRRTGS